MNRIMEDGICGVCGEGQWFQEGRGWFCLDCMDAELAALRSENERLVERNRELCNERDALRHEVERLKNENSAMKNELDKFMTHASGGPYIFPEWKTSNGGQIMDDHSLFMLEENAVYQLCEIRDGMRELKRLRAALAGKEGK